MKKKLVQKSWITWCVLAVAAVLVCTVVCLYATGSMDKVLWLLTGKDEHGLPDQSQYEMVTYEAYTVEQTEFSLYLKEYSKDNLLGTVAISGSGVVFDIGEHQLPRGEATGRSGATGMGKVGDRFIGYKDSLQQLHDAGYRDFFVICYGNGNYFMAGVKDGVVAVLPMWERMKGMEYLYSHFMEPMPIAQAEEAMERWKEYYDDDPNVLMNPSLHPNMMFEDAPQERWMFSPIKNTGDAAYHDPGWYSLS